MYDQNHEIQLESDCSTGVRMYDRSHEIRSELYEHQGVGA
jgi:hypothetical protein